MSRMPTRWPDDPEEDFKALEAHHADVFGSPLDTQSVRSLAQSIFRLADVLLLPRTRTGVVDLPSGPVRMSITDARKV